MCADHEALPSSRASLLLVEEDVPVVVPPNDESLLKAVSFGVLRPGATENRVAATNDELKLIVQHRPAGNVFLVDPKQNPRTGGQLLDGRHERDVPDDGAVTIENLGVLPNAELHLEFGAFRSFEEMGGVVVVRPPFAQVHEKEDGVHAAPGRRHRRRSAQRARPLARCCRTPKTACTSSSGTGASA